VSRRVLVIAIAAALVIAGAWYALLWSPQSQSLHKASAARATAQSKQQDLTATINRLVAAKAQLPIKEAQLADLEQAIPTQPQLDQLIDEIHQAAGASGVEWQSLSPSPPATQAKTAGTPTAGALPGGLQAINLSIQVNGDYFQVTDFVTRLTRMSRLLVVDGVNLGGNGSAGGSTGSSKTPKLSAQITSRMFYLPVGAASASATTSTTTGAPH